MFVLHIKVLGSGCPNCRRLEAETRAALDAAGIGYELTKVTGYEDILAYGVISTPALVINERIVSSGRIPARSHIVMWAKETETTVE
jgi:small redox-active disulfide protein 2